MTLVTAAIHTLTKLEEIVFDDDKNKSYDDETYSGLQDEMDAANRAEMVLQVKSKADAVAKMLHAAKLIRFNRYEQIPDFLAPAIADKGERLGAEIEKLGRRCSGPLQSELRNLISTYEKLLDCPEGDEIIPRLRAVLAWLEGRDWWMIQGYCDGTRIASPNAPKKPRGVPRHAKGYLIEASPGKRGLHQASSVPIFKP